MNSRVVKWINRKHRLNDRLVNFIDRVYGGGDFAAGFILILFVFFLFFFFWVSSFSSSWVSSFSDSFLFVFLLPFSSSFSARFPVFPFLKDYHQALFIVNLGFWLKWPDGRPIPLHQSGGGVMRSARCSSYPFPHRYKSDPSAFWLCPATLR